MGKTFLELLKAKRRIKELEAELEQLQQPPKPEITLLSMSSRDVKAEVLDLGLKLMYPQLMDYGQPYVYTNSESWAEAFNYIYCVFNMPPYLAARMDCEDFGILLKGLVSALFGLNYFAFAIGDIPAGRHGFDTFRTEQGLLIIEPQTAEFFGWEERPYEPEWVLL